MDIKNNDFVQIKFNGLYKLSKVLSISENDTFPTCIIKIIEDDSEMIVSPDVLEKLNIFNVMKTNCPECGASWTITTEGVHDKKTCKICNRDGESLCLDVRRSFLQSKR